MYEICTGDLPWKGNFSRLRRGIGRAPRFRQALIPVILSIRNRFVLLFQTFLNFAGAFLRTLARKMKKRVFAYALVNAGSEKERLDRKIRISLKTARCWTAGGCLNSAKTGVWSTSFLQIGRIRRGKPRHRQSGTLQLENTGSHSDGKARTKRRLRTIFNKAYEDLV